MNNLSTLLFSLAMMFSVFLNAQAPPNDDIEGAIDLQIGDTFDQFVVIASNEGATNSEDIIDIVAPPCANYGGGDIWYRVTVIDDRPFVVETSGADFGNVINDTALAFYLGSLDNLELVGCDDDGGFGGYSKFLFGGLSIGEVVYVRAFQYDNDVMGNFTISAYSAPPPPSNNLPDGAIELTVGQMFEDFQILGDNTNAVASELYDPNIGIASCGDYNGADVWYSAIVPESGNIVIEMRGLGGFQFTDGVLSILTESGGVYTEVDCNDDYDPGFFPLLNLEDLPPGEELLIRAYSYDNEEQGEFRISAYSNGLTDGIEQLASSELKLYPNPANDLLNIESELIINSIQVFDFFGRKVAELKYNNINQIDVSKLQAGNYILELNTDKGIFSSKFVKQ